MSGQCPYPIPSGDILQNIPNVRSFTPLIAASERPPLPKAQTSLNLCLLLNRTGIQQERGGIRKESLRGNFKGGERISRKAAHLSPLLWFPLRICAPRPAKIFNGQKDKARMPKDYESACFASSPIQHHLKHKRMLLPTKRG